MTTAAVWAPFPVPDMTGRYRLGASWTETPDDWWWNAEHPDGAYALCEHPDGWESLTYNTPLDRVGGRDGALSGPPSVGPRELEVEGFVTAVDRATLVRKVAALRRVLTPASRQPLVWEQHDFASGFRLGLVVRPFGQLTAHYVSGTAVTVAFSLVTDNLPWKLRTGPGESAETGLRNPALVGGRTYSRTYPYTYGATVNPGGMMTVLNTGDREAFPVFTVTGPVDYPVITNGTTGMSFALNVVLDAGETATVDARSGTVSPSRVRLAGSPWTLAPGPNTVGWRSLSGTYYPAARLRLDWRSTSN